MASRESRVVVADPPLFFSCSVVLVLDVPITLGMKYFSTSHLLEDVVIAGIWRHGPRMAVARITCHFLC